MTSKAESLAEAIMKMAEEDKGLVKSKLVAMINQSSVENLVAPHAIPTDMIELAKALAEQREKEARKFFQDFIVTGTGHVLRTVKDDNIEFRPLTHEELYGPATK